MTKKNENNQNNHYIIILKSNIETFQQNKFLSSLQEMHNDLQRPLFSLTIEKNYPKLKMFSLSNPSLEALNYLKSHQEIIENIHQNIEFQVEVIKNNNKNNDNNRKNNQLRTTSSNKQGSYSWGIDRINQYNLPLDRNSTIPSYSNNGQNVDVYVIDSGIDTTHQEFQRDNSSAITFQRNVTNVFSLYGPLLDNTDGYGHGTHVAGTIGGNTIGVAKYVNIIINISSILYHSENSLLILFLL